MLKCYWSFNLNYVETFTWCLMSIQIFADFYRKFTQNEVMSTSVHWHVYKSEFFDKSHFSESFDVPAGCSLGVRSCSVNTVPVEYMNKIKILKSTNACMNFTKDNHIILCLNFLEIIFRNSVGNHIQKRCWIRDFPLGALSPGGFASL